MNLILNPMDVAPNLDDLRGLPWEDQTVEDDDWSISSSRPSTPLNDAAEDLEPGEIIDGVVSSVPMESCNEYVS